MQQPSRHVRPPQVFRLRPSEREAWRVSVPPLPQVQPSLAHLAQAMAVAAMPLVTRPRLAEAVISVATLPLVAVALTAELWAAHPLLAAVVPLVARPSAARFRG